MTGSAPVLWDANGTSGAITSSEIDIYESGSESSSDSLLVAAADLKLETFVFLIPDRNEVLTRCKSVPRL